MLVNMNDFRFWDQICTENMKKKNFETLNIKIVRNMCQCTLLRINPDYGTEFAPKTRVAKIFEK